MFIDSWYLFCLCFLLFFSRVVVGAFHLCFVLGNDLFEGKPAFCPHLDQNMKEDMTLSEVSVVAAAVMDKKSSHNR